MSPGADPAHPLPAFIKLHDHFLDVPRLNRYGDREHEWATGSIRFPQHFRGWLAYGLFGRSGAKPQRANGSLEAIGATTPNALLRGTYHEGRYGPRRECAGTDVRQVARITRGPT